MTDTRAKLETLFRRLTDPAVSDMDALADFVWFRKLRLDAKDVSTALGAPAASEGATTKFGSEAWREKESATAPPDDGPMWPFKKKHAGESIAHIARTDPEYLRFMLAQDYVREPLKVLIRAALGIPAPAPAKPSDDFENP